MGICATRGYPTERPFESTAGTSRTDSSALARGRTRAFMNMMVKELTSSVETKNETFVWCEDRICQKRASNASTIVRNFFKQGFEEGSSDYFYTRDQLGSVREVIESDGTTVASRRSYDPWGRSTETGSGPVSDFGFTGHYFDRPTGESLTWYRGYDPNLGRWLSKDPIGLNGGTNLYGYVLNSPANDTDPYGLSGESCKDPGEDLAECLDGCADRGPALMKFCSNRVPPGRLRKACYGLAFASVVFCRNWCYGVFGL